MLNFANLKTLSTFALLVCVVVACKQTSSPGNSPTLKSPDGKFQITVPDDWTAQSPLDEGEIIKAANKLGDIAVVVAFEKKTDLADDMTIDKYADTVRDKMLAKGNTTDATRPESIKVNGSEARQFEVNREPTKYMCLFTVVEAPEGFHRIAACAPSPKYQESKAVLRQLTESFRAVPAAGSDSAPK